MSRFDLTNTSWSYAESESTTYKFCIDTESCVTKAADAEHLRYGVPCLRYMAFRFAPLDVRRVKASDCHAVIVVELAAVPQKSTKDIHFRYIVRRRLHHHFGFT